MYTRCYFDMFDVCQSCDMQGMSINQGCHHELVDSGLYDFPMGYNPLGKSAEDLYMYSALTPA